MFELIVFFGGVILFPFPAITCGHPGNPIFGMTQGNQFNLNDNVRFVCNTGYVLNGAVKSTCQANGQWSNTLPKCRSKFCTAVKVELLQFSLIQGELTTLLFQRIPFVVLRLNPQRKKHREERKTKRWGKKSPDYLINFLNYEARGGSGGYLFLTLFPFSLFRLLRLAWAPGTYTV